MEEEMSHLYLPWGSGERYTNRLQVRNQFASTLELHKQSSYEYPEPVQRQRSPSLPPIHHIDDEKKLKDEKKINILNRNIPSAKRFSFYDEDGEGDTSGYGSETINHMNRNNNDAVHDINRNPVVAWQQTTNDDRKKTSNTGPGTNETPWSARSPRTAEEGRLRWGDRGVATGRLWEPTAPNARLPQMPNQKKGTPSWVERGLNMIENSSEVLIIDQRSSSNSTGLDCDRSSCHGSDEGRTFLRGQNVPLEPEVKAQRESKRIKALELQTAILNQLEEREKCRQEEKERKLKEEKLEELRMLRQQEQDRNRLEEEKRRHEEKQLMEQKKLEALKKALDDAEKKAKQEKEKRFTNIRKMFSINADSEKKDNCIEATTAETPSQCTAEPISPSRTNRTYDAQSTKSPKRDCASHQASGFNSPRSAAPGNFNLFIHNMPPPLALSENQFNIVPIAINSCSDLIGTQTNGIQLAVLVPHNLAQNIYGMPITNINDLSEAHKVLTPNKYRLIKKDACTQTEASVFRCTSETMVTLDDLERNIDKDYANIDENAPQDSHQSTLKKDRRFRSEERYKKELDSRPKWGVNRPAAQYKKQSEKDPFYSQKRKVRQKYRPQLRQYLSQSSEDSRSPSPPNRSDKNLINSNKRFSLSQSYWRNKRTQESTKSNTMESMSNLQLEYNQIDQITANELSESKKSPKISPTKRLTLSQKFINDKYGNRKLWVEDIDDRNAKSNLFNTENRKRIIDQINNAKRHFLERNEEQENYVVNAKF
uniref:CCDC66 domain-containing protein n=1 Tax=Bombyx mori TaxID=7091 RepID=A0A8R2QWE9_BOMMO|nr:uncharacterized protein LOC105842926 isoform X2 [Bombyx mori]